MGLGYQNKLLAHVPKDLKRFKQLTEGKICIQGRNTYESIVAMNGKPLPNRTNIVLTNQGDYETSNGTLVFNSVRDVLDEYERAGEDAELMVIGGSQVYKDFLPFADTIHLTVLANKFDKVDTYFPDFNLDEWNVSFIENHSPDENNPFYYLFTTYNKIK